MILFVPFIMLVVWMVHVHPIKIPFHPVLGAPPPILAISGNIFSRYLDSQGFNIVKSRNTTLVGFPSFSVGAGLGSVTYFSLKYCKARSLVFSKTDKLLVQGF